MKSQPKSHAIPSIRNAQSKCRANEHRRLVKLLDRLIDEVGEDEDHPLASFMEVIGVLIEKYEDDKVPMLS